MAEVAVWKQKKVEELKETLLAKQVVGIANVQGIPGTQIQMMRKNLRGRADLQVVKKTLAALALNSIKKKKKNANKLVDTFHGQLAIITTDINPFKLYALLEATKTAAPAKGGEIAPSDIVVPAGDTSFKPGPVVGELQKAGLPAAIEKGKVVIKSDKVLVKSGGQITRDQAQALTKLEIYPMTVGLDLRAAYEEGLIFKPDQLFIDIDEYRDNFTKAASNALALGVSMAYPTQKTLPLILTKAVTDALTLSINCEYPNTDNIERLIMKANSEMLALKSKIE